MKKEDVIKQLERIFNAIDRYNDKRYFDFVMEYQMFICEEKTYIPQVIQGLYRKDKVSIDDLIILATTYHSFSNYYYENEGMKDPTFFSKEFIAETNLLNRIHSFVKEEIKNAKKCKEAGVPLLEKKPTKNDIVFDYEKLHIQILNELYEEQNEVLDKTKDIIKNDNIILKFNIKTGKYQVNENPPQNIGINSLEYKILKELARENKPVDFASILEHNDSEMRNDITKLLRKRTGLTKENIINKSGYISLSGVEIINSNF